MTRRVRLSRRQRIALLVSLAALIPLGLATKAVRGPGAAGWIRDHFGGAFYVAFFCLAFFPVFPRARPAALAGAVLAATCFLEFLQLWHPPFLEAIRRTVPGALLLGTTFGPADFPPYVVGAMLGGFWISRIRRMAPEPADSGNEGGG